MSRTVAIVVFDGVQSLDLTGPFEAFAGITHWLRAEGKSAGYDVRVVGLEPGVVRGESGLGLVADEATSVIEEVDTLVVPGGNGAMTPTPELVDEVARLHRLARRTASVCTGSFILGEAGVLNGRRCATHWARAGAMAQRFPAVDVDPEPIWLRDGDVWTSAGVSAGIDLALALIEDDHGPEAAQVAARWMVVYLRRPGGQSQFATPVWSESPEREPLRAVMELVHADPAADLSVAALARHAGMSERNFLRSFRRELRTTPARYVEAIRVEAARHLLETTTSNLDAIARRCGFGTAETLRRAFHRTVGVAPGAYRDRFSTRRLREAT